MNQVQNTNMLLRGILSSHKEELRSKIQEILDYYNSLDLEVDLLCCQENVKRATGIEQLAMVDISLRIK